MTQDSLNSNAVNLNYKLHYRTFETPTNERPRISK